MRITNIMHRLVGVLAIAASLAAAAPTPAAAQGPDALTAAINSVRSDVKGRIALVAGSAKVKAATERAAQATGFTLTENPRPFDSSINIFEIEDRGAVQVVHLWTFVARPNKPPVGYGYQITVEKQGGAWKVTEKSANGMT